MILKKLGFRHEIAARKQQLSIYLCSTAAVCGSTIGSTQLEYTKTPRSSIWFVKSSKISLFAFDNIWTPSCKTLCLSA